MSRYASAGGGPVSASKELKQMVKALHNAGIEVLTSSKHGNPVSQHSYYFPSKDTLTLSSSA